MSDSFGSAHSGKLHHIEIYVSDLDRTQTFWSWFLKLLGYDEYQSWDRGVSYRLDESYIVFVQTEERFRSPAYHRCHTGLNHLAFWAASRQQVDEITEKLKQRGLKILYEDRHPFAGGSDSYAVFFKDPDRIKVELVAPLRKPSDS